MSSTKVKRIRRLIDYTATWDAGILTITTAEPHYLVSGDMVKVICPSRAINLVREVVTVGSPTQFTIPYYDEWFTPGKVEIDFFRTGFTGILSFSTNRSTGVSGILQSVVTGTGGATYTVKGSLDNVNWMPLAEVIHPGVSGDSDFTAIEPNWAYLAVDITSIGVDTKLEMFYSA